MVYLARFRHYLDPSLLDTAVPQQCRRLLGADHSAAWDS
jgi:hypothetical protein